MYSIFRKSLNYTYNIIMLKYFRYLSESEKGRKKIWNCPVSQFYFHQICILIIISQLRISFTSIKYTITSKSRSLDKVFLLFVNNRQWCKNMFGTKICRKVVVRNLNFDKMALLDGNLVCHHDLVICVGHEEPDWVLQDKLYELFSFQISRCWFMSVIILWRVNASKVLASVTAPWDLK